MGKIFKKQEHWKQKPSALYAWWGLEKQFIRWHMWQLEAQLNGPDNLYKYFASNDWEQ